MKKMTKADLVDRIASQHRKFKKRWTRQVLNAFYEAVIWGLRRRGRVELRNFGVFYVVELPARVGRNPKTGEDVEIPESQHVRFKMSKRMQQQLNS